jgi:IclR family acetate operon transcriptional repressor
MRRSDTQGYFASRTMQALEVLAFGPSTTTVVAGELQIHPRTARRLLNRMTHDGWLIRRDGPRPTYAPTLRIVALAAQFAQRTPLVSRAAELSRGLPAGETLHLVVPSYRSALRLVRGGDHVRDLAPAHAVAGGKALLAFRDEWRDAVLGAPLEAVTARTVTDPVRLRAELELVRSRGFAVEDGEYRAGVRALAVPVGEDAVAALALSTRDGFDGRVEARSTADAFDTRVAALALSTRDGFDGRVEARSTADAFDTRVDALVELAAELARVA